MHALRRGEADAAFKRSLSRNADVDRSTLTALLADYDAVAAEAKAQAMAADLARLPQSARLNQEDAAKLAKAPAGASGIIVQNGRGLPARGGDLPGGGGGLIRPGSLDALKSLPHIARLSLVAGSPRKLILDGVFDGGTSPIAPVYLRPGAGNNLDEVSTQTVDGERLIVILAKLDRERGRIVADVPEGVSPGHYDVSVRIPRGPGDEPKSRWIGLDVAPYDYTFRITKIKCIRPPQHDTTWLGTYKEAEAEHMVFAWCAMGDNGSAMAGSSSEYVGMGRGTESPIRMAPDDEGAIFYRSEGSALAVPATVAHDFLAVVRMDDWSPSSSLMALARQGTGPRLSPLLAFMADLADESMDRTDADQMLERMSQMLKYTLRWAGSRAEMGEQRVHFSSAELQEKTATNDGRYVGNLNYGSGKAGRYLLTYEVRRSPAK
jgi:hypothetical protein